MIALRTAMLAAMGMLAAAAAVPALAQSGWGMVGQNAVSPQERQASITARHNEQIRELMLCVEDAPVRFSNMVVRFQNGTTQALTLRDRLAAGRCGRAIAVRGRDRRVASVDISYDPSSLGGATAKVQLFWR